MERKTRARTARGKLAPVLFILAILVTVSFLTRRPSFSTRERRGGSAVPRLCFTRFGIRLLPGLLGFSIGTTLLLFLLTGRTGLMESVSAVQVGANLAVAPQGDVHPAVLTPGPQVAGQNVYIVSQSGGGDFSTISAAAAVIQPGDTVRIRGGTYREQIEVERSGSPAGLITFTPYGDGDVWIDGDCNHDYNFHIASDFIRLSGLKLKRANIAAIRIDGSDIRIEGNTIQDYNCLDGDDQFRAGIASWNGGQNLVITDNTISRRVQLAGPANGQGNGIWLKNTGTDAGGGHTISHNTIIGGFDGIGGEPEDQVYGSFYRDTIIEGNTISDCDDDGIQVEGGDHDVTVRDNLVQRCALGVAFAPNLAGPLYIEGNRLLDMRLGYYGAQACFKIGDGGSGTAYLTGNECRSGGDGLKQTNGGLTGIVSRRNIFQVTRYVYETNDSFPSGTSFDEDCLWTTDPERFIKWEGTRYPDLVSFQVATGQELNGGRTQDCGLPFTPGPTPTPMRTQTPTPTPWPTWSGSPTPAGSPALPSSNPIATQTPVPMEAPLMAAEVMTGWNYECYVGASLMPEEALTMALGKVGAVYRLGAGGVFDRWFPGRPEVSTLSVVNAGDALFLLASDSFGWPQMGARQQSTINLAKGWNGVCYLGGSGPAEIMTQGIDVPFGALYSLAPDQTWQRLVPGKPDASSLSHLASFTPVLILLTGENGHWIFTP